MRYMEFLKLFRRPNVIKGKEMDPSHSVDLWRAIHVDSVLVCSWRWPSVFELVVKTCQLPATFIRYVVYIKNLVLFYLKSHAENAPMHGACQARYFRVVFHPFMLKTWLTGFKFDVYINAKFSPTLQLSNVAKNFFRS